MAVTEQSVTWLDAANEWKYLRWEEVRDVGAIESGADGTIRWIPLLAKDGSCYLFALLEPKPNELDELHSEIKAAFAAHKASVQ